MQRVKNETAAAAKPAYGATGTPGYFNDTPGVDAPATIVDGDWANMMQEELAQLIEGTDFELDGEDDTQMRTMLGFVQGEAFAAPAATNPSTHGRCGLIAATNCGVDCANGVIAASEGDCEIDDFSIDDAAIVACNGSIIADGLSAQDLMAACYSGQITRAVQSAVIASEIGAVVADGSNENEQCLVAACWGGAILDSYSLGNVASIDAAMLSSFACTLVGSRVAMFSSKNCIVEKTLGGGAATDLFAGGYSADQPARDGTNKNVTVLFSTAGGNGYVAGTITQGGADYAEYFENAARGVLPPGSLVARMGRAVRLAQRGDRVVGVVSATAGIIGNAASLEWVGKRLRGEFGETVTEAHRWARWKEKEERTVMMRARGKDGKPLIGEDGAPVLIEAKRARMVSREALLRDAPNPLPEGAETYEVVAPAVSEAFDGSKPYVPREQRPEEWTCVGLLGQVRVRVDKNVRPDDFVEPGADGVGTRAERETRLEAMEITQKFDEEKGYAVALCLLR